MCTKHRDWVPARTSPGKRSALAAKTQGGSVKSAMGGTVTLRVGSVNVGTMRGREGEVVEGTRGRGRSRKTWEQCVRDDMKLLGLHPEWAVFRDMWRDLIWGKRLTLA